MACSSALTLFLQFLLLLFVLETPVDAAKQSYIVYLGGHSFGAAESDKEPVAKTHYSLLGSILNSEEKAKGAMMYSYTNVNAFSAIMDEDQAEKLRNNPNVVSFFPNRRLDLHTTHSWKFLGLEDKYGKTTHSSIWKKARFGEDTIIATLDSGVWPESRSFSDTGYGPIPSKWRGSCEFDRKEKVRCNRKLIGARYFNKGYLAYAKTNNYTIKPDAATTPRDQEGHGSHTLSTAAGNFVRGVTVFGQGNGTAKGGAPRARVAAYKVCWPGFVGGEGGGCFGADILAGFDAAISDGVDVISASLGGSPVEFLDDAISLGSFNAVTNGIVVVSSAGNSGPDPETVSNGAPWILTVGASTIDREFRNNVILGNRRRLKGSSLSSRRLRYKKFYPLINGADANAANISSDDAQHCLPESLDPEKVKGKILVCLRGQNTRPEKGQIAALAGAVGMILVNDKKAGNYTTPDPYLLQATNINYDDGNHVLDYLKSAKNPLAYITRVKTIKGEIQAPSMAQFSSRGPYIIEPSLLKPDVTAPGVNIIAAFTEAVGPSDAKLDNRRVPYITQSGTSMACPHVSGIAGLLKTLYPSWSPAAIKSAIITTAISHDNSRKLIQDSTKLVATPFAYGAGHVNPNRAAYPGLVYDLSTEDYLNLLCARGYNATALKLFSDKPYECSNSTSLADFNYPTITVPSLGDSPVTITRRVKNVGKPNTYVARVRSPPGVSVSVEPNSLDFSTIGEEKEFKVTFKAKNPISGKTKKPIRGKAKKPFYVFGKLVWSDRKHIVRSPIVVLLN